MIWPIFINFISPLPKKINRKKKEKGGFGQDSGRSYIAYQEVLWMRLALQSSWNLDHCLIWLASGTQRGRRKGKVVRREDPRHWGRYNLLN